LEATDQKTPALAPATLTSFIKKEPIYYAIVAYSI
jgi:hypothetical protein